MNRDHPLVRKYSSVTESQRDSAWVAEHLGVTRAQLNKLVYTGQICPVERKAGARSLRFELAEVERYLASLENEQSV